MYAATIANHFVASRKVDPFMLVLVLVVVELGLVGRFSHACRNNWCQRMMKGSTLRLATKWLAIVAAYINGEHQYQLWGDCQNPLLEFAMNRSYSAIAEKGYN
jgi:hypothetical protein